jgi:hypothetical protein
MLLTEPDIVYIQPAAGVWQLDSGFVPGAVYCSNSGETTGQAAAFLKQQLRLQCAQIARLFEVQTLADKALAWNAVLINKYFEIN